MSNRGPRVRMEDTSSQGLASSHRTVTIAFVVILLHKRVILLKNKLLCCCRDRKMKSN